MNEYSYSQRHRKRVLGRWLRVLLVLVVLVLLAWVVYQCTRPVPPPPTPTVTKPVSTKTYTPTPTKVVPTPTFTKTPTPTRTPYPTKPVKTPTPAPPVVKVHTGYEGGWLHYREGPSLKYRPLWREKQGAVQEGTILEFLGCPDVKYPWVWVRYLGMDGYVYGEYVNPNLCK